MDTYLANDIASRQMQISKVSKWLAERTAALREDAEAAEQQVQMFVQTHNVSDVQGSSATALQLSKDQGQLALARQELARQQAALETILHSGGAAAQETLGSKTISQYREREAGIMQQIARLSPSDDRRVGLQQELNSIRGQIDNETNKIVSSIKRDNEIARTSVHALEMTVINGAMQAHTASVDAAELMKLKNAAEAKRQMYISFGTRSEQTQLASAQLPSARILYPASTVPRHSMVTLASLCGFIGGIIVSISVIILRETVSTKIDSTAKVAMVTGLPAFGCLPEVRKSGNRDILAPAKTAALVTETLRAMWLAMQSQAREGEGAMVVVTSSEIGEGKTTVAAALARKTAADGYRVLLIDADLRRPRLAVAMNLRPEKTLEAVLKGSATLSEAVIRDPQFGVHCLLSQGNIANPMRVLASDRFKALLAESKSNYDFVVLDSPPVLRVADAVLLAKLCQHILFIVGSGRVPGELVVEAVQRFSEEDRGKIIPLLTRVRPSEMNPRDYFGGYDISHASL
jgi:capsular exopolysaccharide synthesis family protein